MAAWSGPNWKPAKGTAWLERKLARMDVEATRKVNKAAARRRDMKCRWPKCECYRLTARLEVAHIDDLSRGGTDDTDNLVTLCFLTHQGPRSLHSKDRAIVKLTPAGANGPLAFYMRGEDGVMYLVARETSVRILERD